MNETDARAHTHLYGGCLFLCGCFGWSVVVCVFDFDGGWVFFWA